MASIGFVGWYCICASKSEPSKRSYDDNHLVTCCICSMARLYVTNRSRFHGRMGTLPDEYQTNSGWLFFTQCSRSWFLTLNIPELLITGNPVERRFPHVIPFVVCLARPSTFPCRFVSLRWCFESICKTEASGEHCQLFCSMLCNVCASKLHKNGVVPVITQKRDVQGQPNGSDHRCLSPLQSKL